MKYINVVKRFGKQVTAAGALVAVSAPSFATGASNPTGDAINAAIAAGQNNVGLVTAGVIGLAALGFGLTMIVAWLRK